MDRSPTLDIVRALAMLLVLTDHAGYTLHPLLDHIEVPAFFILSGMLMKPSDTWRRVLTVRLPRIVVPLFLYSAIYVAVWSVFNPGAYAGLSASRIVVRVVYYIVSPLNSPLWFLKALIGGILLLKVLFSLKIPESKFLIPVILLTLLATATGYVEWGDTALLLCIPQTIVALALMAWGALLRPIFNRQVLGASSSKYKLLIPILAAAALVAILTARESIHIHQGNLGGRPWLFFPASLSCFIALAAIIEMIGRVKILETVGRHTLSLLGLHKAIYLVLAAAFPAIAPWAMIPAAVGVCLAPQLARKRRGTGGNIN